MAHDDSRYEGLPATWPFRAAGTILIVAFSWFTFGFAVEDMGDELSNHLPVFYVMVLVAILFIIGGAAYNIAQSRKRRRIGG